MDIGSGQGIRRAGRPRVSHDRRPQGRRRSLRGGLVALAAAGGLALAPMATEAHILIVPGCGEGGHILVLPGDPRRPADDRDHCSKACHAVTERRNGRKTCC